MTTKMKLAAFAAALFATAALGRAETLELKNGTVIQGTYAGGTATTVNIQTAVGVLSVPTTDVVALKFGAASTAPAAAPATAPAPAAVAPAPVVPAPAPAAAAPAAAAAPVSVPAGTVLTIRVTSQVASTDRPGTKFTGTLLADLMAGTAVVAKAGTTVYGQVDQSKQAGRLAGKSQLSISLTGVDQAGKILPIMTTNFAEAGKGEFRKTARNTAAGAVVGNAIDDDGGAGKGAAVGAGVSLIKKGDAATVPPGALLEFRLAQPVSTMPL